MYALIFLLGSSYISRTGAITSLIKSLCKTFSRSTPSSCWVETTTVSSRTGRCPSYSIVTCVFPSGRKYPSVPFLRTLASCSANLCAIAIGSGINSGVSLHAYPNIKPWSPAPCKSNGSTDESLRLSKASSTPWAISGDCFPKEILIPQDCASNPTSLEVYPISDTTLRINDIKSGEAVVVTSPAMWICPVVKSVSTATRDLGS